MLFTPVSRMRRSGSTHARLLGAVCCACAWAASGLAAGSGLGAEAWATGPERVTSAYNVGKSRLAAGGYDVVGYFPEGGGIAQRGEAKFEHVDRGITYRFTSQKHLELFRANPDAYIPAHGGWCSWAMAEDGSKVEVDPKSFLVMDGRLFLFYKGLLNDTRAKFVKDAGGYATSADANWQRVSGEGPIMGAAAEAQGPLQRELDAKRSEFDAAAPAAMKETFEEGVREVGASGVLERALKVGAKAPEFELKDATGAPVALSKLLEEGPVVLTWYRGGWCPYCNIQLQAYQQSLAEIRGAGGQLVAISPELPDNSLSTKEKNGLAFVVLSDVGSAVARAYGVSYRLPDSLIDAFKGRLDLATLNGDDSWELPLGATYVIARDGTIAYAFLSEDYRERAEPGAIVEALKGLR
jgi:peroxiredoxin/YHS domain-containing protein